MYIGTGLHEASMFELESVNLVFNNDLQITAPAKLLMISVNTLSDALIHKVS